MLTSNNENMEPEMVLHQCIALLKGPSDEHKFAGLMMITKHVAVLTQEKGLEVISLVMESIGSEFIRRLLRTASDEGASIYQEIAVGILNAAARDHDLLVTKVAPHCQQLVWVLRQIQSESIITDVAACLFALSEIEDGLGRLVRATAGSAIVHQLLLLSKASKAQLECESSLLRCLNRCIEATEGICLTSQDFAFLAYIFSEDKSERSVSSCNILLKLTSREQPNSRKLETEFEGFNTAFYLRRGFFRAFHGVTPEPSRDMALVLAASLLHSFGQEWCIESFISDKPKEKNSKGTFVRFLLRIACNELRILLDEALGIVFPSDETPIEEKGQGPWSGTGIGEKKDFQTLENIKNLPKFVTRDAANFSAVNKTRLTRTTHMLPIVLGIIDSTVHFLCSQENEDDGDDGTFECVGNLWRNLPGEVLMDMKASLDSASHVVLDFFGEIRNYTKMCILSHKDLNVLCDVGRLCAESLGIWLAEDCEVNQSQFLSLLPFLFDFLEKKTAESFDSDDECADIQEIAGTGETALGMFVACLVGMSYDDIVLEQMSELSIPIRVGTLLSERLNFKSIKSLKQLQYACALLLNMVSRGGDIPFVELNQSEPQYFIVNHPYTTRILPQILGSLIQTLSKSTMIIENINFEYEAKVLVAYAVCLFLQIARMHSDGSSVTLVPVTLPQENGEMWCDIAVATKKAIESCRQGDELGFEEGSIWQWCAESASEIKQSKLNPYILAGIVRPELINSLLEAKIAGRL